MQQSHLLVRVLFLALCPLLFTYYTTTVLPGEASFASMTLGIIGGLTFGALLIGLEAFLKKLNFRSFTLILLGLFCGYLLGNSITLVLNEVVNFSSFANSAAVLSLTKLVVYCVSIYFGVMLALRANDELQFIIPFVKLESASKKKKDIVVDSSTLLDTRIIDLALTGLLDNHLIIPKFILKELNNMNDQGDEAAKAKARRCFEVIRKLESISGLNLRYVDTDFPDLKDSGSKLSHLARMMDASIMTADLSRPQQTAAEGVRTVNIHALSNAFKAIPQSGEYLTIKVQRKGKEVGQGVGYLEDGTMVVVNGGEEYIFETIRAQILSVKSTSSGRMVFCNAAEDEPLEDRELSDRACLLENNGKNYFATPQE
ncbi:MAG: hypothetical protein H0T62_07165 [Parachlamydiaceae bacterium]|nr:hypothetical protein [Parachlamydiaceae bacterium]